MRKLKFSGKLLALLMLVSSNAFADESNSAQAVESLQHQWEVIKFEIPKDKQESALATLAREAQTVSERFPGEAEPLIWEAVILSTYAGAKGGFGALKLVKKARDLLFQAEKINPVAMSGSVYASLGNLYHNVPGWPIGFGSDSKARTYLEKALQINPDGIEPNYFYGELLYGEGEYQGALRALNKAMEAPPRKGRELSDIGQRKEIATLIEDVKRQL